MDRGPGSPTAEFDPQTSGGLLAAVDPGAVDHLVAEGFVQVGKVAAGDQAVTLR
jgi:hypothetical protein